MRAPDGARSPEPKPERRMTRARARDDQGASEPALETSDPTRPAASVPLPRDGHEDAAPAKKRNRGQRHPVKCICWHLWCGKSVDDQWTCHDLKDAGDEAAQMAWLRELCPGMDPDAMSEYVRNGPKRRRIHTCHFRNASKVWVPPEPDDDKVPTLKLKEGAKPCNRLASSVPTRAWMPLIEENFTLDGTSSDESVVGAWGGPLTPNSSRALRRVASDTQGGVDSGTYKVVSDLLERKSGEHAAFEEASDEKLRELRAQVDGLQRQLEDQKRRNAVLQRDFDELCFGCYAYVIGPSRDNP